MITVTRIDFGADGHPDDVETDTFADPVDLTRVLENGADDYRDQVLTALYAGETRFTVPNGPHACDVYQVT